MFSVWLVAEESVVFELGVCAFGRRGETLVSIKLAHLDNKFNGALILFLINLISTFNNIRSP